MTGANKPKKKGEEAEEDERRPEGPMFRTLGARVNFLVIATAASLLGVALYAVVRVQRFDQDFTSVAAVSGILIFVITWFMLVLGDILISRKARRLADAMSEVLVDVREEEALPRGLGELEDLAMQFDILTKELTQARKTCEQQVKVRTSVLEFNKGMAELERARTEALLTSIGEGVAAADKDGKLSFVNDVARKALWWKDEKVEGIQITDAFKLEDEQENPIVPDEWPLWEAMKTGKTIVTRAPSKPYYLRRSDRTRLPVRMVISPVLLRDETVGALVIFDDITDQVEFDQRKSEFISIASHQLRSPGTVIKMIASMFRGKDFGEMNPQQMEWVEKMYVASDSLLELINQLLNISRLETGVKMSPEEHEPSGFLEAILKESEPLLLEKRQKFVYERHDLPKMVFDALSVGETLKNLISNAVKYSPEDSGITVAAEPLDGSVKFSVKDQGMGIPKEDQARVFSKFFRASNVIEGPIKGTGLGLYYCKSVVEKHGGQMGFRSEEGQGTTFWFTLPIAGPPPEDS